MAARPRDFKSLVTTDFTTLAKVRENQHQLEKLHESSLLSIPSNYIKYIVCNNLQNLNRIIRISSTDIVGYIFSLTTVNTVNSNISMSF